jgi:hypothetical protein
MPHLRSICKQLPVVATIWLFPRELGPVLQPIFLVVFPFLEDDGFPTTMPREIAKLSTRLFYSLLTKVVTCLCPLLTSLNRFIFSFLSTFFAFFFPIRFTVGIPSDVPTTYLESCIDFKFHCTY